MEADGLALSFGARVTDMLSPEGQATGNPDPFLLAFRGCQRRRQCCAMASLMGLASPRMVAAGLLICKMGIITSPHPRIVV